MSARISPGDPAGKADARLFVCSYCNRIGGIFQIDHAQPENQIGIPVHGAVHFLFRAHNSSFPPMPPLQCILLIDNTIQIPESIQEEV